jgi:hypothetical protein
MDEDDQFGIYADEGPGHRNLIITAFVIAFWIAAGTGIWLVGRGRGWW